MRYIFVVFFTLFSQILSAEETATVKEKPLTEETVVTQHKASIGGNTLDYKTTTGTLLLPNEKGETQAAIFYVAYTKEGEKTESRPITFCFNGGPGSSSVWLNIGAFGPKRVDINQEGTAFNVPLRLLDNSESILDITDLVFIDPVSTGYSRAAPGVDAKQFHSVEKDVDSVADFIRRYVTKNERWLSPKYIAGESYGTTRAGKLVDVLLNEHRMTVDGVVLISSVLNFQTIKFADVNDLPYILFLPSYTAAAFYQKKLSEPLQQNLQETLQQVEKFAYGPYAEALMWGDRLDPQVKKDTIEKLSMYTGLDREYLERTDLRILMYRFCKELMRGKNLQVGRFDSRILGYSSDACADSMDSDPSFNLVIGPFASAYNQYLRQDLGWKSDEEYRILAKVGPWDYSGSTNQYLDVTANLRDTMTQVPSMKVFVASGYYDLALPYLGSDYTMSHLGMDPALRKNIVMQYYEAGHMMYLHYPSLVKMKKDLTNFYSNR